MTTNANNFIAQPHFSHLGISGYGDFFLDKTLIEVKSTKSYLKKVDVRQVAMYYLLSKASQDPKKRYNIQRVAFYYPLFQSYINMSVGSIFHTRKTKLIVEELEKVFNRFY